MSCDRCKITKMKIDELHNYIDKLEKKIISDRNLMMSQHNNLESYREAFDRKILKESEYRCVQ